VSRCPGSWQPSYQLQDSVHTREGLKPRLSFALAVWVVDLVGVRASAFAACTAACDVGIQRHTHVEVCSAKARLSEHVSQCRLLRSGLLHLPSVKQHAGPQP